MKFKHGDVVELNSGSPKMTVIAIVGVDDMLDVAKTQGYINGDVSVEYFANNKRERGLFKQTSIRLSESTGVSSSVI